MNDTLRSGWRRYLEAVTTPISAEQRDLLARRWESLPEDLKTDRQVLGRHLVHCGYTLGASYCSLGCSHCYLPKNANRVPLPGLDEMKAQIDANRRQLGAGGGLQLTGGDLPEAYARAGREGELVTLLRHAREVGLVPMLMTHGRAFLDRPRYLERLVGEGGLRKLAVHVDTTQPVGGGAAGEADLDPLRQRFVELVLETRRRTGVALRGAWTVTVTGRNLDDVPAILRWAIDEPARLDAFRMISLQTEADVGRTRGVGRAVTPEAVWSRIEAGVGRSLPRDNLWFGHPDCSTMTTLLVRYPERRVDNLIGADAASRAFWSHILDAFGGLGSRGNDATVENLRRLALLGRRPDMLWRIVRHGRKVIRDSEAGWGLLAGALRGRVRALNIVMHNFMGAEQVAAGGPEVERRLAACAFRGAVRRNGDWQEVPMCTMNALERETLYARSIDAEKKSRAPWESGPAPARPGGRANETVDVKVRPSG